MSSFAEILYYQPQLRPELPEVIACKEYHEERNVFIRIDEILRSSGLEQEFIALSINEKNMNLEKLSASKRESFCLKCTMALRGNIARMLKNLPHREFCILLPDSMILRWFIGIEQVDAVKAYAKSTSDRLAHWLNEESLQYINAKLVSILNPSGEQQAIDLNLVEDLNFESVFFDSTCLKADIHYPVDWVLLRDLTRTLMKGTVIIRREGLVNRMPQEPLDFLSDMNKLAMKMTSNSRVKDGKKKRKKIYREMQYLAKRIINHARHHLSLLEKRGHELSFSEGRREYLKQRLTAILDQVDAAIDQAYERIIGERQVKNEDKKFSLYNEDINCLSRGKSNAKVEFGNKLWLGETSQGLIVDYVLEKDQTVDSKHVIPALQRITEKGLTSVKKIWGDRGLDSKSNQSELEKLGVYNGICPKSVRDLKDRLDREPDLREGLKRRAATEGRIKILIHDFMGDKPRALTHNLWVLARLPQKEVPVKLPEAA